MPKAVATKKTKEQISKAATSSSKGGRKKWTKGRVKDKVNNAVFFDKALFDKMLIELGKMKLITVSTVMDKLKVTGSLARKAIRFCQTKDIVKPVGEQHHSQYVYTTAAAPKKADEKAEGEKPEKPAKGKQQQQKKKDKAAAAEAEIGRAHV